MHTLALGKWQELPAMADQGETYEGHRRMRRASSVDENQSRIVRAFRQFGCSVQPLHAVGNGVPDLLCAFGGINFLVEVKDGAKTPSKRKLTPDQETWHREWNATVFVAEDTDDVCAIMMAIKMLASHAVKLQPPAGKIGV